MYLKQKQLHMSNFDNGQIVMARLDARLENLQTAGLVGCSPVGRGQYLPNWSKKGQPLKWKKGHRHPRFIDAHGERRLARVVWSHGRITVAQIPEKVNAGCGRNMSEDTVHCDLLFMEQCSHRPVRLATAEIAYNGHNSIWTGAMVEGCLFWWVMFTVMLCGWPCMCVSFIGEEMAIWQRQCDIL